MESTNNLEEQNFRNIKRNQRRIHGNRDVGHVGSMENIPVLFIWVPYEMFKLEHKRFYAELRGRIIKSKHTDSEIIDIIEKGLENMEMQVNGLLTPMDRSYHEQQL